MPFLFYKDRISKLVNPKESDERIKKQGKAELEKGDLLAICIAAVRVFLPVLLGFIAVVYGLMYLFLHGN